jgi:hypothetical protein
MSSAWKSIESDCADVGAILSRLMNFRTIGVITNIELIAKGRQIKCYKELGRQYGGDGWRKLKGVTKVQLKDGSVHRAEIHWYEANGVGRKRIKIKRFIG